jgi:uncharacterized protein YkwD
VKQAYVLIASFLFALAAVALLEGANASPAVAAEGGLVEQCGGGQISLEAKEYETFLKHNSIRRDRNLPTFCVDPKLTEAAEVHSQDMIDRDYFSHDTKGKREDFAKRIKSYGYDYRTAGENIAWGTGSLGSTSNIVRNWMKSTGHRKNILNKNFREIGIGVVDGEYRGYGNAAMYTVDFGTKL